MKLVLILLLTLITSSNFAFTEKIKLDYENYDQAISGEKRIRFNMESTKAGVITTSFTGVVKKGTVTFKRVRSKGSSMIKDVTLSINAKSLDTDNTARNEKMYEQSLSIDKYPKIIVSIKGPVKFNGQNQGVIEIRGKQYPIMIYIGESKNKNNELISGHANVSLKSLGIPDPSIWIASVRDLVEIEFQFIL